MAANAFEFTDPAILLRLQGAYTEALLAIANGAQSYNLNGVNVNRAQLSEAKATLADINLAIRLQSGSAIRSAHPLVRPLF